MTTNNDERERWIYAQKDNKNREIRLNVQAKRLYELGETASTDEVDKLISLTTNEDGWRYDSWKSHKDFEISINAGYAIRWFIIVAPQDNINAGYRVKLVNIYHNSKDENRNFFDEKNLKLSDNQKAMTSTVLSGLENRDNFDSFSVDFSITHNDNGIEIEKRFTCDPKLRIKS